MREALAPSADGLAKTSAKFSEGARQARSGAASQHPAAVLKANSPFRGNLLTHDGTFTGVKVTGEGVTAALLKRAMAVAFSELNRPKWQRPG